VYFPNAAQCRAKMNSFRLCRQNSLPRFSTGCLECSTTTSTKSSRIILAQFYLRYESGTFLTDKNIAAVIEPRRLTVAFWPNEAISTEAPTGLAFRSDFRYHRVNAPCGMSAIGARLRWLAMISSGWPELAFHAPATMMAAATQAFARRWPRLRGARRFLLTK
jgi:hypothetical protein